MLERSKNQDRLVLMLLADLPQYLDLGIVYRHDRLLVVVHCATGDLKQFIAQGGCCEGDNLLVLDLDQQLLLKRPVRLPSVRWQGYWHIDYRGRWQVALVANNDQAEVTEERIDLFLCSWAKFERVAHVVSRVEESALVLRERLPESLAVIEQPDLSVQVEVVVRHRSAGQPDPLLEHGQVFPQRLEPFAGWVLSERQLVDDQSVHRQHLAFE